MTLWTAVHQASLSITYSWSLLKLMSIESVMPSSHLIFCLSLILPPSIFPRINDFSSESVLHSRWPKYWSFSFSISPSNDYSGLISFRMDWLDLLAVKGSLKSLLQHHNSEASILWCLAFFMVQLSHPYMTTRQTKGAMLSKSLIQFSVDGQSCVPSLLFDLRPTYGGGNGDNGDLLQNVPHTHCYTQCPQPSSRPPPTHASTRDSWTLTGKSGSSLFMPSKSLSSVLCNFWRLYGGDNGSLLQEGLCHTQVCCTQSPCPCDSPLLTCTSARDTQTQFCLSLCGFSRSWCTQSLFQPSEHLWRVWGLILNAISPLLLSFWASPLPLDVGYLLKVVLALQGSCPAPTILLGLLCPWTWGISSTPHSREEKREQDKTISSTVLVCLGDWNNLPKITHSVVELGHSCCPVC